MKRKHMVWCVCLTAWLIGCTGWAAGASRYEELCADSTANRTDAIAWIEIPGAEFCQPVMCREEDDSFYASHSADGKESELGALYIQPGYNAADFTDPVSVIYGGSKQRGAPLRDLQELYSGRFEECGEILLHLPEETLCYEVFAAVPYSSIHILHYYDFSKKYRYEGFFDGVYSTRLLGMHLDVEKRPEYGERVLILSTGLRGDATQRYLVMARLTQEEQEDSASRDDS